MAIELIGGKILVCQIKMKLLPGVNPEEAAQGFLARLQIPAGFHQGTEITMVIHDPAKPSPNGRLG